MLQAQQLRLLQYIQTKGRKESYIQHEATPKLTQMKYQFRTDADVKGKKVSNACLATFKCIFKILPTGGTSTM